MIHSHNNSEHERIMDTAVQIRSAVNDLYVNHHNGNVKLNKRIKVLDNLSTQLITRLEMHVENTEPLDDVYNKYNLMITIGKWVLGVAGVVLAGVLINYFNLM